LLTLPVTYACETSYSIITDTLVLQGTRDIIHPETWEWHTMWSLSHAWSCSALNFSLQQCSSASSASLPGECRIHLPWRYVLSTCKVFTLFLHWEM